jgi:hypothetical protein
VRIQAELRELAKMSKGVLRPRAVVLWAYSHKNSALHSQFEWNDGKAAEAYRIWQARELIRCSVLVIPGSHTPVRAYVSLTNERWGAGGGGYRPIGDVLSNVEWRERMLVDALEEMRLFREKYQILKALRPVFQAAAKVEKSVMGKKGRRSPPKS